MKSFYALLFVAVTVLACMGLPGAAADAFGQTESNQLRRLKSYGGKLPNYGGK